MMPNLKITVIKTFSPEDVFGHAMHRSTGERIPPCSLKEGEEFIVDSHLHPPDNFCNKAWQDIYPTLMILYYDGKYDYPETGVTYTPCADGVRPVIFKIEKLHP